MAATPLIPEVGLTFSASTCAHPRTIAVLRESTLTGFQVPCRLLNCRGCGNVRLNRAIAGVWESAFHGESIYHGSVADECRGALQKRVLRRNYLIRLFPTVDALCVFFTTDPREGKLIHTPDVPLMLVNAWHAMLDAKRRCGGSRGWTAPAIRRSMSQNQKCLGMSMVPIEKQAHLLESIYGDRIQMSFADGRWSFVLPTDMSAEMVRRSLGFTTPLDRANRLVGRL